MPDLSDVDALLAKPRFSADTFDPDPRFQLFEQKSVYDKLPGSYVDQPLGTLYPNALNTELNHTLTEAWRFNPVALSTRRARETACELACTPGHGLNQEAISWVRSIGLSRVQALYRETEADDVAAKSCLLYEHYAELYANPSGANHTSTLQEELEDFYDPLIGESDPSNHYDPRYTHNVSGPSPEPELKPQQVDGTEVDKNLNGLNINTMRSSLPARRGWLGGMPTPVSTADPSRHSSVCLDYGYGAASLPTPDTGISFAAAHPSDGSTVAQISSMISPPLSGVNFASASRNYHRLIIPADHAMPSAAQFDMSCSPPNNTTPVKQSSYHDNVNLAPINTPTFKARLAPLRDPKQIEKRLALLGDDEEIEWGPRREGPYDFIDFCSASLESERSDGSEPKVNVDGIDGAAHFQTTLPNANGMDGAAIIETPVLDAAHYVGSACPNGPTLSDEVTDEAPTGAESTHDWQLRMESLEAINTGAASSGHTTEQIASATIGSANERPTPTGTPEQAFDLAQDLEQSIDSAVSQTASLARVLGKPSPPVLPELAVAAPKAQGLQKYMECLGDLGQSTNSQKQTELSPVHDGKKDPQTQSNIGSTQTESVAHEAHQLSLNTFTTPVPQHDLNHQTAIFTKPIAIDFTSEYSASEEAHGANLDSLSFGIFSSPTNQTQGGQNALSLYVRETSSHPNLYAYDDASKSTSMSMSISSAGSVSPEPEDLALTPTNTEFGLDTLTPSDDLEDVNLIDDSFSTTPSTRPNGLQQSYGPNLVSAYSSYVNALGPPSSSYYATSPPALTTPNNNTPPNHHLYNPSHISTPYRTHTLVLPSTTPGTPTPAPNPSHQHRSKNSSSAMLRHRNPSMDAKMRKSVKIVFESKKLGSRSPSPGEETRSDNDEGIIVGRKFIMENGQPMKRVHSSPAKLIPAHVAHLASIAGTYPQDIAFSAASIGMARTKSQDQVVQAVVVPGKRKSNAKPDEDVVEGSDGGQVRKRLRRSIRMSGNVVAEGV